MLGIDVKPGMGVCRLTLSQQHAGLTQRIRPAQKRAHSPPGADTPYGSLGAHL